MDPCNTACCNARENYPAVYPYDALHLPQTGWERKRMVDRLLGSLYSQSILRGNMEHILFPSR
jgi:hypothetical protein